MTRKKRSRRIGAMAGMSLDIFGGTFTNQEAEEFATEHQLVFEEVIERIHKSHPNNKLTKGRL